MFQKRKVMSKKDLLSKFIYKNPLFDRALSYRKQKNIHILAYHRVVEKLEPSYIFNSEIFSTTLKDFEAQMKYVSKHFNVINFENLEKAIADNKVEENTLIVTFDDGYYDNYSLAMPVLNKYDISATVFLATDYIDSGKIFWFDAVAGFVNTYSDKKLELSSVHQSFDLSVVSKVDIFKSLGRILKKSDDSVRVDLLDEIYTKFNFEVSSENYKKAMPLSWDNVIEMSNHNIEFGAHSKSHCFLNRINENQLKSEISESKLKIEDKIGKAINSFCYPAGVTNASIMKAVESCGINFGVGYYHGLNNPNSINQYNLNREHVELDVSMELFKANLTLPEVFMR